MVKKTTKSPKTNKPTRKGFLNPNRPPVFRTWADARNALLIVSLLANLFVFCLWLALQSTSHYDQALVDFFIHR